MERSYNTVQNKAYLDRKTKNNFASFIKLFKHAFFPDSENYGVLQNKHNINLKLNFALILDRI